MVPPLKEKNSMRLSRPFPGMFMVLCVVLVSGHVRAEGGESGRLQSPAATAPRTTYAVVNVAPHDVLNIRARPDIASPVVGKIPPYGVDVHIREAGDQTRPLIWMPIRYRDLTGWVSSRYLARQVGSVDEAVSARAGKIMWALKQKDMATLSQLVHPDKGVRFSPYAYVSKEDLVFRPADMKNLMRDKTVRNWGDFDGTGQPINLTFDAYFMRFIYDADFVRPQQVGCNIVVGRGNTINNITAFYPNAFFIEYHFEGMDPQQGGMDWRSLRLILEEHKGAWYLVGITHDEWTI
jgi:hypothetical protein